MDLAISGIQAGMTRMAVSANNVANINTEGFKASRVTQSEAPGGGTQVQITQTDEPTDYATEAVDQMVAGYAVRAGIATLRAANDMTGTLLNLFA